VAIRFSTLKGKFVSGWSYEKINPISFSRNPVSVTKPSASDARHTHANGVKQPLPLEVIDLWEETMTTLQDTQRASLRVLMADPTHGLPEYSADPKTVGRVGNVIGAAAGGEERHVRGSDSHDRFVLSSKSAEQPRSPNLWLWSVLLATPICTVALLAVLAYSRFR
jgi:hypothetical protein